MRMKVLTVALAFTALAIVPFFATPSQLAAEEATDPGMALYNKKCAMCHGKDGVAKAMAKGSANLNDAEWQSANTVEQIVKITVEGEGKMPKYAGKLTPEEIESVAKYVKTLK